jgi:hypothetical protein
MIKKSFKMMLVALVMMGFTTLSAQNDLVIKADKESYSVGDKINVSVSVKNDVAVKDSKDVNVWYCLVDKCTDVCIAANKKAMPKISESQRSIAIPDDWVNKWVKIFAENSAAKLSSNEVCIQIKPKKASEDKEAINADRWTNKNTPVYSDCNSVTKKAVKTLKKGTKVYATDKYTCNGKTYVKISEGYVNVNDLSTADPSKTAPKIAPKPTAEPKADPKPTAEPKATPPKTKTDKKSTPSSTR